jgi:hypothetical protein
MMTGAHPAGPFVIENGALTLNHGKAAFHHARDDS